MRQVPVLTLTAVLCCPADYALLCVDAATGITRITREHLAVAVALEVPTALVVTKSDAVDEQQLQQVLDQLHQLMQPVLHNCIPEALQQGLRSSAPGGESSLSGLCATGPGVGSSSSGVPLVQCEQQAIALAAGLTELHSCTAGPAAPSFQQAVFPVFVVSGVTGAGIHLLHAFLSHLKPLQEQHKQPSSSSGCTSVASVSSVKAAGGVVAAALSAQQQPQVSAGLKAASSSQLWGVSPKKQPPLLQLAPPAHAATPAATTSAGTGAQEPTSVVQEAAAVEVAEDGDECRPGHFQVVHTYDVEGVGWVVSGIAVTGRGRYSSWQLLLVADMAVSLVPRLVPRHNVARTLCRACVDSSRFNQTCASHTKHHMYTQYCMQQHRPAATSSPGFSLWLLLCW